MAITSASPPASAGAPPKPPRPPDWAGLLRRARRESCLSQRELAAAVGTSRGVVGAVEAGSVSPSGAMLVRLFGVMGCRVTVVDEHGAELRPMGSEAVRDAVGRHYPSHLDVFEVRRFGDWWHDKWCTVPEATRPEYSFSLFRPHGRSPTGRMDDERVPDDPRHWGRCSSGSHVVIERRGGRDPRLVRAFGTSARFWGDAPGG